jgi:hypothetical protein
LSPGEGAGLSRITARGAYRGAKLEPSNVAASGLFIRLSFGAARHAMNADFAIGR